MKVLIFISLLLLACGKTHRLSKSDLQWNPYTVGDRLIFQSGNTLFDTVIVTGMVRHTRGLGYPFSGNPDKGQSLSVVVNHLVSDPGSFRGLKKGSIFIMSNYGKGSYVTFWFAGVTKGESISNPFFIGNLDTIKPITYSTKAGTFDDVVVIKSDTVYPDNFDRLSTIFWSRKFGYLEIEVNDSLKWELIGRLPAPK